MGVFAHPPKTVHYTNSARRELLPWLLIPTALGFFLRSHDWALG
jgi:hypothetical protein